MIFVSFLLCRKPRVEIVARKFCRDDFYIFGKNGVERMGKLLGRNTALRVEMSDLSRGMNARVCSSAPDKLHVLARNLLNRGGYNLLNGNAVRLNLPAAIVRPIVFYF